MNEYTNPHDFLRNFIITAPLYKTVEFDAKWYSNFAGFSRIVINDYCDECIAESVFDWNYDEFTRNTFCELAKYNIDSKNPIFLDLTKSYRTRPYFIVYPFACARCKGIHYYTLMFKGNTVTKIGQYPSFASMEKREFKKYKNLKAIKKYYVEFVRSVNAYSQHMGIASFVYLRRIYEYIVETEYSEFPEEKKNGKASFDEKMKAVGKELHIIPETLESQKSKIYSILSKGIHEYEEEECYEMYPILRNIIIFILNKYLAQKEEKKLQEEARKFLASN